MTWEEVSVWSHVGACVNSPPGGRTPVSSCPRLPPGGSQLLLIFPVALVSSRDLKMFPEENLCMREHDLPSPLAEMWVPSPPPPHYISKSAQGALTPSPPPIL